MGTNPGRSSLDIPADLYACIADFAYQLRILSMYVMGVYSLRSSRILHASSLIMVAFAVELYANVSPGRKNTDHLSRLVYRLVINILSLRLSFHRVVQDSFAGCY